MSTASPDPTVPPSTPDRDDRCLDSLRDHSKRTWKVEEKRQREDFWNAQGDYIRDDSTKDDPVKDDPNKRAKKYYGTALGNLPAELRFMILYEVVSSPCFLRFRFKVDTTGRGGPKAAVEADLSKAHREVLVSRFFAAQFTAGCTRSTMSRTGTAAKYLSRTENPFTIPLNGSRRSIFVRPKSDWFFLEGYMRLAKLVERNRMVSGYRALQRISVAVLTFEDLRAIMSRDVSHPDADRLAFFRDMDGLFLHLCSRSTALEELVLLPGTFPADQQHLEPSHFQELAVPPAPPGEDPDLVVPTGTAAAGVRVREPRSVLRRLAQFAELHYRWCVEYLETAPGRAWLASEEHTPARDLTRWLASPQGTRWRERERRVKLRTDDDEEQYRPEPVEATESAWLQTPSAWWWLATRVGQPWLETPAGVAWLGTRTGRAFLGSPAALKWAALGAGRPRGVAPRKWYRTDAGKAWKATHCPGDAPPNPALWRAGGRRARKDRGAEAPGPPCEFFIRPPLHWRVVSHPAMVPDAQLPS
ncbi:hypothetical protein F4780DRAFT_792780 [Xylariomycetidae sp. FL0641]|nr:hypothetical protein F4780DRAFT_792780 [Xylariomycetidae sp. FL0641]